MDQAVTITEFLEARIAEDEAAANAVDLLSSEMEIISTHHLPEFADYMLRWQPNAVRAECAAKRALLMEHFLARWASVPEGCRICRTYNATPDQYPCMTVRTLAAVYKDHLDYQQEWA